MRHSKINSQISIHAPPRGATAFKASRFSEYKFQFTPLREGRRNVYALTRAEAISIHAPPRGATLLVLRAFFCNFISIHAPPRGATQDNHQVAQTFAHFNSRPSARGDSKRYAISANLLFNPYKSAWLNNRATQFVEIILVIFHRIIA